MVKVHERHFKLSGQQQVKVVQSNQRRKHQLARFWPLYFGMHKVFCLSIILRNSKYYIALLVCLKEEIVRKWPQMKKKKSAFSLRSCTISQVDCNDGESTWTALQIASTPTLFFRSGPQWLLAVCRLQKNASEKEIWLQWISDIGNWGVFWGQRQIFLQKRHRNVREALESVYHSRKRLDEWSWTLP